MGRNVTSLLDIVGIGCLTVAGALVAPALGFAVLGAGALLVSRALVRGGGS